MNKWRLTVWLIASLSALLVGFHALATVLGFLDSSQESVLSTAALIWLNIWAALFAFSLVRQPNLDARLRRAWLFLGLGFVSQIVAEGLWFYLSDILGADPFPSLADIFYLAYYPLVLAGLLSFPYAPVSLRERRLLWLDLGIIMVVSTMILWFFVLHPISLFTEAGLAAGISTAYPVGDLLLLLGLVSLIQRDLEKVNRPVLFLLCASLVATAVSDVLFSYLETHEIPYVLAFLNIGWLVSAFCELLAAGRQLLAPALLVDEENMLPPVRRHRLRTTLPYLSAMTGAVFMLIVIDYPHADETSLKGLLHGLLLIIGLVLLRQHLVLRDNISLLSETQKLAITDSLTGLYNRHHFNQVFVTELKRAARYNSPLSVLLIDVDDFKQINDTQGHLKGDKVLHVVAQALAAQVRRTDFVARFGGDEFAILLPETDSQDAQAVIQRLRESVAKHQSQGAPLGVTIGLATSPPTFDPEHLLEQADRDLYRQKGINL